MGVVLGDFPTTFEIFKSGFRIPTSEMLLPRIDRK